MALGRNMEYEKVRAYQRHRSTALGQPSVQCQWQLRHTSTMEIQTMKMLTCHRSLRLPLTNAREPLLGTGNELWARGVNQCHQGLSMRMRGETAVRSLDGQCLGRMLIRKSSLTWQRRQLYGSGQDGIAQNDGGRSEATQNTPFQSRAAPFHCQDQVHNTRPTTAPTTADWNKSTHERKPRQTTVSHAQVESREPNRLYSRLQWLEGPQGSASPCQHSKLTQINCYHMAVVGAGIVSGCSDTSIASDIAFSPN
jgi:hypothetical protein